MWSPYGPRRPRVSTLELIDTLTNAPLSTIGRMRFSSNATFLMDVGPGICRAIYKPAAGEQPLWDFPPGLWRREVAAYVLSESLGLGVVPHTVHRTEGPFGEGSLQLFIDARFQEHYFSIRQMEDPGLDDQLRSLCAFDLVANSADRKAGHCLIDGDDRIWAIDNGLTFHHELKLRTVIWDFAGEAVPLHVVAALQEMCDTRAPEALSDLLTIGEIEAMMQRAGAIVAGGHFPFDETGRRYPWPLV